MGIFAVPFVPLVVSSSLFFPFITGKAFVFRLITEIVFVCYLVLAIRDQSYRPQFNWVIGSILTFLLFIGLADIFAQNPYKAFWSNYERMEGFVSLLHFGALFVVMGSVLKNQQIWNKLLTTSLGASAIMAIYSFFQMAGKITINQGGVRVDGTLGNASYLGIYMVFHIFFAALLLVRFKTNWQKILVGFIGLIDLVVLYFTATRGAILGLVGGTFITFVFLVFKSDKGDKVRKLAGVSLVGIIFFVGLFFALKDTRFVNSNPVLSRFATLSISEIKTQGRYYIWPMAYKGFVEKPILGWGQEGFNFVFNKYYDPRMYSQEPWFDRAHNTYLDWAIAGGALGLLSYLGIIFSVLYYIFKSLDLEKKDKAIILGLISAYLFNNIFVFDQTSSYILFFTVLAYVYSHAPKTSFRLWDTISNKLEKILLNDKLRPTLEALALVFFVVVIYFVIYAPWQQNKSLLAVLSLNNQGKIGTIEEYTKPLAGYGMGFSEGLEHVSQTAIGMAPNSNVPVELKQNLFNVIDKSFKKHIEKVPNDARYRLFYGVFLSRYGWYGRAVEQLKEAQKLSPLKQGIAFELTSNLLLDNKGSEALQVVKTTYESEPSYEEAKFIYGLVAMAVGENNISNKIFSEIEKSKIIFDDRYLNVLLSLGMYNDMIDIIKQRINLDQSNLQHRITLTATYLQANRREEAIQTLEQMIKMDASFKERGEYYINEIKAGRNP